MTQVAMPHQISDDAGLEPMRPGPDPRDRWEGIELRGRGPCEPARSTVRNPGAPSPVNWDLTD